MVNKRIFSLKSGVVEGTRRISLSDQLTIQGFIKSSESVFLGFNLELEIVTD